MVKQSVTQIELLLDYVEENYARITSIYDEQYEQFAKHEKYKKKKIAKKHSRELERNRTSTMAIYYDNLKQFLSNDAFKTLTNPEVQENWFQRLIRKIFRLRPPIVMTVEHGAITPPKPIINEQIPESSVQTPPNAPEHAQNEAVVDDAEDEMFSESELEDDYEEDFEEEEEFEEES